MRGLYITAGVLLGLLVGLGGKVQVAQCRLKVER